jgi:hypothetical protein
VKNERLKRELEDRERNSKQQTNHFPRRERKTNPKKPRRKKVTKATHRDRPAKVDRELHVPVGNGPACCCQVELTEVHQQFQTDLPSVTPVTTQFHVEVGTPLQCVQPALWEGP